MKTTNNIIISITFAFLFCFTNTVTAADVTIGGIDYDCEDLNEKVCVFVQYSEIHSGECKYIKATRECVDAYEYDYNSPSYNLDDPNRSCQVFSGTFIDLCEKKSVTNGECKLTKIKNNRVPKFLRNYQTRGRRNRKACQAKKGVRIKNFRLGREFNGEFSLSAFQDARHIRTLMFTAPPTTTHYWARSDEGVMQMTEYPTPPSPTPLSSTPNLVIDFQGDKKRNCEIYSGNRDLCKYAGYEKCVEEAPVDGDDPDNPIEIPSTAKAFGQLLGNEEEYQLYNQGQGDWTVINKFSGELIKIANGDGDHQLVYPKSILGKSKADALIEMSNCKVNEESRQFSYNVRKHLFEHVRDRKQKRDAGNFPFTPEKSSYAKDYYDVYGGLRSEDYKAGTFLNRKNSGDFKKLNLFNYQFCVYAGKECLNYTPEPIFTIAEWNKLKKQREDALAVEIDDSDLTKWQTEEQRVEETKKILNKMENMCDQFTEGWLESCYSKTQGNCYLDMETIEEVFLGENGEPATRRDQKWKCKRKPTESIDKCGVWHKNKKKCNREKSGGQQKCVYLNKGALRFYNEIKTILGEETVDENGYCHTITDKDILDKEGDSDPCHKLTFIKKQCKKKNNNCRLSEDGYRCQRIS